MASPKKCTRVLITGVLLATFSGTSTSLADGTKGGEVGNRENIVQFMSDPVADGNTDYRKVCNDADLSQVSNSDIIRHPNRSWCKWIRVKDVDSYIATITQCPKHSDIVKKITGLSCVKKTDITVKYGTFRLIRDCPSSNMVKVVNYVLRLPECPIKAIPTEEYIVNRAKQQSTGTARESTLLSPKTGLSTVETGTDSADVKNAAPAR